MSVSTQEKLRRFKELLEDYPELADEVMARVQEGEAENDRMGVKWKQFDGYSVTEEEFNFETGEFEAAPVSAYKQYPRGYVYHPEDFDPETGEPLESNVKKLTPAQRRARAAKFALEFLGTKNASVGNIDRIIRGGK